jgi:hypothetical protein
MAWVDPIETTGVAEQVHHDADMASKTLDDKMNWKYGPRSGQEGLRPRKP